MGDQIRYWSTKSQNRFNSVSAYENTLCSVHSASGMKIFNQHSSKYLAFHIFHGRILWNVKSVLQLMPLYATWWQISHRCTISAASASRQALLFLQAALQPTSLPQSSSNSHCSLYFSLNVMSVMPPLFCEVGMVSPSSSPYTQPFTSACERNRESPYCTIWVIADGKSRHKVVLTLIYLLLPQSLILGFINMPNKIWNTN